MWDVNTLEHIRRTINLDNYFPTIVTLCGSTRFMDEFILSQKKLTLEGKLVISVGLFGHQEIDKIDMEGDIKKTLDELHFRKIDLADEIFVINGKRWCCSKCGKFADDTGTLVCTSTCRPDIWKYPSTGVMKPYIGFSTRNEIEYALGLGKPIKYLNELTS